MIDFLHIDFQIFSSQICYSFLVNLVQEVPAGLLGDPPVEEVHLEPPPAPAELPPEPPPAQAGHVGPQSALVGLPAVPSEQALHDPQEGAGYGGHPGPLAGLDLHLEEGHLDPPPALAELPPETSPVLAGHLDSPSALVGLLPIPSEQAIHDQQEEADHGGHLGPLAEIV